MAPLLNSSTIDTSSVLSPMAGIRQISQESRYISIPPMMLETKVDHFVSLKESITSR